MSKLGKEFHGRVLKHELRNGVLELTIEDIKTKEAGYFRFQLNGDVESQKLVKYSNGRFVLKGITDGEGHYIVHVTQERRRLWGLIGSLYEEVDVLTAGIWKHIHEQRG